MTNDDVISSIFNINTTLICRAARSWRKHTAELYYYL